MALAISASQASLAGGLLTNTNQSINFLRNPARDGAIGIDGTYYNPAGVVFMPEGLHLAFSWQYATQTRTPTTTNPLFALGAKNNGQTTKRYKGEATAPFLPSLQAAYNKGKWSLQFNFAVTGGGGKATFDNGLGSFEGAVAGIGKQLGGAMEQLKAAGIAVPGITGYDMDSYMQGKQYYFGFTVGTAYKITDNLSVYGGLRALYGTASYKAKIDNIRVLSGTNAYTLPQFMETVSGGITATTAAVMGKYEGDGMTHELAMQQPAVQQLVATGEKMTAQATQLAPYANGVNLQSDQSGFGIAPIIGVDYKVGNFNFGAKYEFRTRMSLENKSTVKEAMAIEAVNQFQDGTSVREDCPALLTVGAQWNVVPTVRVNGGYHHFYDRQSKKYGNKQKLLSGGTDEYLGGVEWDAAKKLTVSSGFQITRYGLTDKYMSDMSFVVNSWSFGLGAKYQVSDKVAVEAAYFQTNYGDYDTAKTEAGVQNSFTRTNKVLGVGVQVSL